MASFLVLVPRMSNGERDDDGTVFIRDGFSVLAFILPLVWLLVHRLWFVAALVLGATIAISMVGTFTGHEDMAAFVTALLSLLVGFEANNWRAAVLERRGFEQLAVVDARNADDAETAWFLGPNFAPTARPAVSSGVKSDGPLLPTRQKSAPQPTTGMVGLVSHRGEN